MKRIIILLMLLIPVILFSQVKYYFDAINGDDARSVTTARNPLTPWKTVRHFDVMFTSANAGDSLLFRVGQTFQVDTVVGMVMGKSGTTAAKINVGRYFGTLGTTDAANAPNPIIDGYYNIPSGAWASIGGGLYTTTIPSPYNLGATGVLSLDGNYTAMGKLPKGNQGYYNVTTVNNGTNTVTGTNTNNGSISFQGANFTANSLVGGEIVWRAFHWILWRGTITANAGTPSTSVTYTPFASLSGGPLETPQVNFGFFIQNHPLTCTNFGEWAYNTTTHVLTINFGASGPATHVVRYSGINNLVNINGSNISINNISFRGAVQFGMTSVSQSNILINGCKISDVQRDGVFMNGTATGNQFINDTITNIGSNGIRLASGQTAVTMIGNVIRYIGNIAGMGGSGEGQYVGIIGISGNSTLRYNMVKGTGYNGISFNLSQAGSNANNLIVRNTVDSFGYVKDDAGGIYCDAQNMAGTRIDSNIVLNGLGAPIGTPNLDMRSYGIYNDDAATNLEVGYNTCAYIGIYGAFNHRGIGENLNHNTFYNNGGRFSGTSISGGLGFLNDGAGGTAGTIYKHNISFAANASNPTQWVLEAASAGVSGFFAANGLDSNNWCKPINETQAFNNNGGLVPLATWKTTTGQDAHSVATPWSITDTSQLLFFYNNTSIAKSFTIGGTALDVFNVSYSNNVTLAPFTSIILKKITTNPPLVVTATAGTISCFGGTTTINASATGGSGSYQFKLGSGSLQSSGTFTGVAAGTYTITVQDGSGATASTNITITQPSQITITQTHGAIAVNGGSCQDTVTASGGTGTLMYSMDGGTFQSANTFTLLAGNHTVTVRDANLCTNSLSFTITQPSVLVISAAANTTPIRCFGGIDTIVVTASGATPPYLYSDNGGTSFQSSNQFNGVTAGTYTIVVKDNAGATQTTSVSVTQNTQISITESNTTISVNGGTCTVTITASGGSGSLTYSLDGGTFQSSNVFSGVLAGNHTVVVKDGVGCTNSITFTITQPSVLVVSAAATVNPLLCFGATTTITVTASGGTAPYSYQINGGTPQSSNLFTSRGAGTYTLTVTDNSGVIQSTSLTITQPTQITISESHTAIVVNGGTSTVTITASGGTSTLTYSVDGGAFQGSNVFNNVIAGNHTVTVKDVNACTNSLVFNITQPSALIVSAAITTAIACNNGTGTVTVTASGGTTPYQYKVGSGSLQSSNIFAGLIAGTYTFTVQDAGGSIASTTIVVTQPAQISVGTSVSGAAPATVTVTASGGVSPFNYKLDAGSFQVSNVFNGVTAGNHTITVRDANLCTQTTSFTVGSQLGITAVVGTILCNAGSTTVQINATGGIPPYTGTGSFTRTAGTYTFTVQDVSGATHDTTLTITQPSLISVSESNTAISTNGGTCTVTITASGGVGTLQYSLDGGTYQTSNQFLAVFAGNHSVSVKDGNGCIVSLAFSITQPGALGITIGSHPAITCFGGTVTINVFGNGGTTPYKGFRKDGGALQGVGLTSFGFGSVTAGTHTFSVVDALNNQKDTIFTITQPTQITISVAYPPIGSNGGTTTVTVTASGGTSTLTYSLDGAAYQGSNVFAGVAAGPHTIAVKDANGCINTFPFTITQPTGLVVGISHGSIDCYGGSVTVTVSGSGGTTPYQFAKNGVFQTSGTFSSTLAGTYTFSVKDTFGARSDTIITITQPTQIVITVTTGTIGTNGGNTTVTASASGGTGSLQYSLDGGAYQGTGNFSGVLAGVHTVTVKDANNCTNTNTFSISQPGILIIGASVATNPLLCYGDATNVTITASGGTTPYTGTGTFSRTAGTYTFTVTDQFGAQADTIITITQATQITVTQVVYGTITTQGGTAPVTITVAGGTPVPTNLYYFQIDGGGYVLGGTANTFTWNTVTAGNHTINVKDNNGCIITYQINMPGPPKKGKKPINHIYVNG